jgi:hypothetical protein
MPNSLNLRFLISAFLDHALYASPGSDAFSIAMLEHRSSKKKKIVYRGALSLKVNLPADDLYYLRCFLEVRDRHAQGNADKIVARPLELN